MLMQLFAFLSGYHAVSAYDIVIAFTQSVLLLANSGTGLGLYDSYASAPSGSFRYDQLCKEKILAKSQLPPCRKCRKLGHVSEFCTIKEAADACSGDSSSGDPQKLSSGDPPKTSSSGDPQTTPDQQNQPSESPMDKIKGELQSNQQQLREQLQKYIAEKVVSKEERDKKEAEEKKEKERRKREEAERELRRREREEERKKREAEEKAKTEIRTIT